MSFPAWLDRVQRDHPVFGLPLAVIYKYFDDQGAYLAALITYYGFIAIFPMLLVLSSVLGFALQNDPGLHEQIMGSAVRQIPVLGDQISFTGLEGSTMAVTIGLIGAIYGAMGVAQAVQHTMNFTWNIPRNRRPNPFLLRAKSLLLLLTLGAFVLATTALSQFTVILGALGTQVPGFIDFVATTGSLVISAGLYFTIARIGTAQYVGNRTLLPGALLWAVFWQILQTVGGNLVRGYGSSGTTSTYGVFAVVLGLLLWIYLAAVAYVLCTELNVVLAKRLYPRSLLTPMTDDVDLTSADRRAYTGMARAQRLKGFQHVEVTFEHDGQYATALRRERAEAIEPPGTSATPKVTDAPDSPGTPEDAKMAHRHAARAPQPDENFRPDATTARGP